MILNLLENSNRNDYSNTNCFVFETNAQNFKINYSIKDVIHGNFPHVGITAREGICVLYFSPIKKTWLNVDVYTRSSSVNVLMSHMVEKGQNYKIMIYGPILSKLNSLYIEISDDYYAKIINEYGNLNVSIFGGIHSFGIGCTTVGLMFSNILGRKLNLKINNISFNEQNYLLSLNKFLKKSKFNIHYNVGIVELDYYNQSDDVVEKNLRNVVHCINECCDIVIGWFSIPKPKKYKKDKIYEILSDEIEKGIIIIEDCSFLYDGENYEMCTFGNNFINDAGNVLIFKRLQKILGEL
ncbi:hypothetical protein [Methanobrevibacter gottschalkii]|uniref:hypothetical protein n=1 Tax=Methanobrevibacter gottschalkii TaxID=190974 RepID=UPI0038D2431E